MQGRSPRGAGPRRVGATLVMGMALIAAFVLVSWWRFDATVDQQRGDAAVIDLAGQQRLLSQRIALEVDALTHGENDPATIRERLGELTATFRESHATLLPPLVEEGASDGLADVYHRPNGVDDQVGAYLELVDEVVAASTEVEVLDRAVIEELLDRALDPAPEGLLGVLDQAVVAHREEAERRVEDTGDLSVAVTLGQLLVLLAVGLGVFRPLASRLRAALHDLAHARDDLAAVLDHAAIGILTVDDLGRIEAANRFARHLLRPGGGGTLVGQQLSELATAASAGALRHALFQAGAQARTTVATVDLQADDGRLFTAEMTVTGIKDHDGTLTVLVSDVSERLEILRELEHLAHNDVLTGLPNRRSFRTSLSAAVDRGSQAAVLFIDLNGFKTVNDTHGHAAGDEVLTEVARRLVLALRDSDIVARLGGDEFAGLLYRCDIEQAQAAADRIVEAVAHPIATSAGVAEVTAAVGISFAEGASVSADAVLQSADTAMYRAKAAHQASIRAGLSPCRPVDVELTDAVGR